MLSGESQNGSITLDERRIAGISIFALRARIEKLLNGVFTCRQDVLPAEVLGRPQDQRR